ncbi:MAG: IS1634 family transposase [Candidatus Dormibacteria bacterium]
MLRRSYREGGKVKTETVGNISHLPRPIIELIRRGLAGEVTLGAEALETQRSLAHGHVAAVLAVVQRLGLEKLLDPKDSRQRRLVVGMVVARLVHPRSKLETTRWWKSTTLPSLLEVADADEDELYSALDWLLERQPRVEQGLARRHLREGSLVLYDLSSSYVEGKRCPLAKFGYSRDRKRGKRQVEYGLLTDGEGRPVAIEVYPGNTGDPATVEAQVEKLQRRFHLRQVLLVGDRGMLTQTRVQTLREQGVGWITALRSPQIRKLVESGSLQLGLFDERNLAEIEDPEYPGERLVVCRNPLLAKERARKREALLEATEADLQSLVARVNRGELHASGEIGVAVGRVINRHKVGKHFQLEIGEGRLQVQRRHAQIAAEAQLDGIYVLRTSLGPDTMATADVVRSYKRLTKVERDFRALKTFNLQLRPIRHWNPDRVRAHIFLCMLALYVRWHLEQMLAPLLFRDPQPPELEDPVLPRQRSPEALRKAHTQQLHDGTEVHSLASLLDHLGSLNRTLVLPHGAPAETAFTLPARLTPLQELAFSLLGLNPARIR